MKRSAARATDKPHERRGRLWRLGFAAYGLLLTVGLLWPGLTVPVAVPRPDLIVHGLTFGVFTWLAYRALREGGAPPRPALLLAAAVGVAFGGVTEWLQRMPIIRRSGAWDDFYADCLGVGVGLGAAWGSALWRRPAGSGNR